MATLKKWSAFFNRTNLSDTDNAQVMVLDSTAAAASRNQRTPVTQLLRSGKNLSDLASVSTSVTNLGAVSTNTANALVKRDGSGNFSMGILTCGGATIAMGAGGTTAFNVTGTNATCTIGANLNLAQASGSGAFFSGTVSGDTCIRQSNTGFSIYLGVGSGTAQQQISNTAVNFRVNPAVNTSTNPAITVGTNFTIAQPTANAQFFTNGLTGDCAIRQSSTTNTLRLGVGTGAQASGLDISLTAVSVNLATLACAGSLTVAVNASVTGTLSAGLLFTGSTATFGSALDASSIITLSSTTAGFLPPRMTTTQKNAISSPTSGLIVYDLTLGKLCVRGASAWETITSI